MAWADQERLRSNSAKSYPLEAAQEPQECQSEIDNRFNKEAVQKGHKVLRLHHEDSLLYTQIIQVAVRRCRDGIYGSIDFSRAYGADVRTEWNLRLL